MPHSSFKVLPGVDQNKTPALNEAAISESQLIRFIPDRTMGGLVQKLGGWSKYFTSTIGSTVKNLWAWEDTNANSYLAVGAVGAVSGNALSVISSNVRDDITPQTSDFNVAVSVSTTAGSNQITITDTGRNVDNYDTVYIKTQISVGGLVLFGQYQCFQIGANTYRIFAQDAAGESELALFTTLVSPLSVTGASGTGTVATLTYTGPYTFQVGSVITVTGINPAGYNGTYVVTASTPTSVSYANTTSSAYVSGGSITNRGSVPLFSTTSGSDFVTILLADHGLVAGDTFPVLLATKVGGVTLFGNYIVREVTSSARFVVSASNQATSTDSVLLNGGNANYFYYNGIGPVVGGTGYGVGGYGRGGYGTGSPITPSPGTPITALDWTLDNWGETLVACPLDSAIYTWNPTNGDRTALVISSGPPVNAGVFVAMPQRQIIAWGSTFTGIGDPLLIRWCDVNNYDQWTANITNQAGSYRIPKGSRIVQCIQGPQQGLVWTDLAIWAMQYTGPPYVYSFNEIGTGCGLIGRRAATSMGGTVYWMGPSQFFRLSSNGVEPIRCPIWDVIFQDIDTDFVDNIRIAPNSRFGEVSWFYPTIGSNGQPTKYVKYNILLDCWDFGSLSRTAWINESVLGPPIGASGDDNFIFQHEVSKNADGNPMVSSFQTGYFVLSEADVKMFIDQIWPDMKWGYYDGVQSANVRLTFYVTDYPGQAPLQYGPFNMTQSVTFITPRFRGRLVSVKLESSDIDSWWRIGNIRYRVQPDGKY